jgi:aspartyl-tRNA(Asn)/glutamyl-tRNA(Gln) amidotransferase subunit B
MVKIGLEIHGYLNTKEKLFCNCKALHGLKLAKPNTNICPICTGQPGAKPMLPNSEAVKKILQAALILNCKINNVVQWKRKHYSWPDLPKGYQNTISGAYALPVGEKGKFLGINITETHLEEDPAAWDPNSGTIDYNRSGLPLIEIVTEPEFISSEQVANWLKQLLHALSYVKAIDKNMGIKADVNISIPGGQRVEVKNVNSINNIQQVIDYEIQRQEKEGQKHQETRAYDSKINKTIVMRTKEQAADYRFITDPDLPVLKLEKSRIEKLRKELPESPDEKLEKLIKRYKIDEKSAKILTQHIEIVEFFETIIEKIPSKIAVPWTTIELLRILNYNKTSLDSPEIDIKSEHFIELLKAIEDNKITENKAKLILNEFYPKSFSIKSKLEEHKTISSSSEIEKIAKEVIKENKIAVDDYKSGKKESLNFLIGQLMKKSERRADFKTAKSILEKLLK